MDIFSIEGWYVLLRWFHVLAGITWIGMLYYFNFVQTPFFGTELGGQARCAMVRGLVPSALWWFRWGAMITFLTGWLIVFTKLHEGTGLGGSYMTLILTGGLLGTLMWANVWFVIWPAQQVVIANATRVIGYGVLSVAANECHLLNICIAPAFQRSGHGARLVAQLLHIARQAGARNALLEVRVSNTAAFRLYHKLGFNEIGQRHGYYPGRREREDALGLAREL